MIKKLIQTKYHSRNNKIVAYRRNHTLEETAQKFGITSERVRQVHLLKDKKYCTKHDRSFYNKCSYCLGERYKNFLRFSLYENVLKEVKKERDNRKRDYLSVQRRIYLIKRLRDIHHHSFKQISVMLQRHISTIKYLYGKSI